MRVRGHASRSGVRVLALTIALTAAAVTIAPPADARDATASGVRAALAAPLVGIVATPGGGGYWQVALDGGVFTAGDAAFHGSTGGMRLNQPIIGIARTPSGNGYWLVATDGGIFSFGDARFYGSTGAMRLNQPIVGMASTPTGNGYWLVAKDGGIFAFGDAGFYGSTGSIRLNQPIVGMASTSSGRGYWLVASDGGVFGFGDAGFYGSTGSIRLNQPITGIAAANDGRGYIMVAKDGGVFPFGSAEFFGSAAAACAGGPAVGIATSPSARGYWIAFGDGRTYALSPSSAAPVCAPSSGTPAERAAADFFTRLNAERAARGRPALVWDANLAAYATNWSGEMSRTGFRHSNIGTLTGGSYNFIGENIAFGSGGGMSAGVLHVSWMKSTGHRANMLSAGFDVVGIGVYCVGNAMYATQVFGHRTSAGAPPSSGGTPPQEPIVRSDPGSATC